MLISASVHDLQSMINICVDELDCLNMKINPKKSTCIRFGKGFNNQCAQVCVDGVPLEWSTTLKYLGLTLKSAVKFSVDTRVCRSGFYKSFNAIYSKICKASADVIVSLVKSYCLPSLLYCVEVLDMNVSSLQSLDNPLLQAFAKIFKTFDKNILNSCMFYMNVVPPRFEHCIRKLKFIKNNLNSVNMLVSTICKLFGHNEIKTLDQKFKLNIDITANLFDVRESLRSNLLTIV